MPDTTMQEAAKELHSAVMALKELIEREYPSRREVERRFTSKESAKKRVTAIMLLIVVSAFLSFTSTVATGFRLFPPGKGNAGSLRNASGYEDSMDRQRLFEKNFKELNEITRRNSKRLNDLES